MNTKSLITIVIVLLAGILAVMVFQANEKTPIEKMSDGVNEFVEEVGDEIDDNTTVKE